MPGERTDSDNFQMPKSLIYSSMVQVLKVLWTRIMCSMISANSPFVLKLILRNGDPEGVVQKIEELGASIQNLAHTSRKPHGDPELLKDGAHAEQNEVSISGCFAHHPAPLFRNHTSTLCLHTKLTLKQRLSKCTALWRLSTRSFVNGSKRGASQSKGPNQRVHFEAFSHRHGEYPLPLIPL